MPITPIVPAHTPNTPQAPGEFFHVEYYCPRQAPTWQRRSRPIQGYGQACSEARAIKPARGLARVLTLAGRELYRV